MSAMLSRITVSSSGLCFRAIPITAALSLGKPQKRFNSQQRVILLPELPPDTAETNPILKHFRDGFPDFSNVKERHCYFGLGKALLEFEAAVCELEDRCRDGIMDFDSLFKPLEEAKVRFESVWNSVNLMHIVSDALDRDRFTLLSERAERAILSRHGSRDIYNSLVRMKAEHEEKDTLNSDQLQILNRYLLEYKHQGFEVPEKKKEEFNTIWLKKVGEARREYNYKIQAATNRFTTTVRDPNVVRDFPLDVLKAMASDSLQPTKGPWTVTLHPYIYRKFLEYCPERDMRWNVYQAYVSRGSKDSDSLFSVYNQVNGLRRRRADMAATLGYQTFADMAMDTKMAANVENVQTMIRSLLGKAKTAQENELENLQQFAEMRGFENDLASFDVPFFKRKQRRSQLGLSDDDLRDFFPLPKVVTGVFKLCQDLFDLKFEEVKENFSSWDQNLKLFRVIDGGSSRELGQFFFDPYIRNDKSFSGGDKGWYIPLRAHSPKVGSTPLGAMIFTFPLPGYGKPSLLNFDEVREILRVMGSLLLHMLAESEWSDLSGKTGLERDVMDLASNFMTHLLYTPEVLTSFSGHWSSNEPLSEKIVNILCDSRKHLAGYELCQELFKSAFDITFYTETNDEALFETVERLHKQYILLPLEREDSFPSYFSEIMCGDLPASYYTSVWCRMLAADAFSAVQEVGMGNKEEVKKITRRFRNTFLAKGSSMPPAEVFRQFRGRDPSHEALLITLGLKERLKPKSKGSFNEAEAQ